MKNPYNVKSDIELLHPWMKHRALSLVDLVDKMLSFKMRVYETLRSRELQNFYFKRGKSKLDGSKKVSLHQLGLAVDMQLLDQNGVMTWKDQDWAIVNSVAIGLDLEHGFTWKFKDSPHFQPNKHHLKWLLKEING